MSDDEEITELQAKRLDRLAERIKQLPQDRQEQLMSELKAAYTVKEAAEILSVHPETIRRLIREDKIDAAKVGDNWRVSATAINAYWRDQGGEGAIVKHSPTNRANSYIDVLRRAREQAGDDWEPSSLQVRRLAEVCALATFHHYQQMPMLEWEHDAPKPDDWSAFHEAFGTDVDSNSDLSAKFVDVYEQAARELKTENANA